MPRPWLNYDGAAVISLRPRPSPGRGSRLRLLIVYALQTPPRDQQPRTAKTPSGSKQPGGEQASHEVSRGDVDAAASGCLARSEEETPSVSLAKPLPQVRYIVSRKCWVRLSFLGRSASVRKKTNKQTKRTNGPHPGRGDRRYETPSGEKSISYPSASDAFSYRVYESLCIRWYSFFMFYFISWSDSLQASLAHIDQYSVYTDIESLHISKVLNRTFNRVY